MPSEKTQIYGNHDGDHNLSMYIADGNQVVYEITHENDNRFYRSVYSIKGVFWKKKYACTIVFLNMSKQVKLAAFYLPINWFAIQSR